MRAEARCGTRIAGSIQGQRVLTVKRSTGPNTTMEFILFVLKQER